MTEFRLTFDLTELFQDTSVATDAATMLVFTMDGRDPLSTNGTRRSSSFLYNAVLGLRVVAGDVAASKVCIVIAMYLNVLNQIIHVFACNALYDIDMCIFNGPRVLQVVVSTRAQSSSLWSAVHVSSFAFSATAAQPSTATPLVYFTTGVNTLTLGIGHI